MPPQVGVGVAAFIFDFDEETVLLLKRAGSHGAGTWAPPGGWVEAGEGLLDAAEREVFEEVGLAVEAVQEFGYTEDHFPEGVHDVCFSIVCKFDTIEGHDPQIKEPDKITEIRWVPVSEVESLDLFLPMQQRIDSGDFQSMYDIFKENPPT